MDQFLNILKMIIPVLLIAVGLAMDAFSVCASYGVCHKSCDHKSALRLSACTGLFQFLMPLIGCFTGAFIGKYINNFGKWIAFAILAGLGIKMIIDAVIKFIKKDKCEAIDISRGFKLIIVGITTSIDAFIAGLSLGLLDFNIFISAITIGIITFLLSLIGVYLGKVAGFVLGKWAEIFGGIILIGLGIKALLF